MLLFLDCTRPDISFPLGINWLCFFLFGLLHFGLFVSIFSSLILFFDACLFSDVREKERGLEESGFGWVERWGASGRNWGTGNCNHNILYKKIHF